MSDETSKINYCYFANGKAQIQAHIWNQRTQFVTREFHVSRWLEAHLERNAGLTTFPRNLVLADIFGDGDYRLILSDVKLDQEPKAKLKVYKGTTLISEQLLPDIPSAIISFHNEMIEPFLPVIGVACGSELLVYKNNKPFFKFSVPPISLTALEKDAWQKLPYITEEADFTSVIENLKTASFSSLSARSQYLLSVPLEKIKEEVQRYAGTEPIKRSPITCLTTLNKSSEEDVAVTCPVIGTENGQILVLDPQTFTILQQANIFNVKSSPFIIKSAGLFDVEYRIIVACRENYVCFLKQEWIEGKILFRAGSNIVDMLLLPADKSVVVALSDKDLCCYSKKGNKLWVVKTLHQISCLCLLALDHLSTLLVAVGMRNGAVHLFQGRHPVDYISVPDTPSAMAFGQLGQEEHVLIIVTLAGALNFKILKRTADFNLANQESIPAPTNENKPLPLPKRSKLFLEQIARERQNAIGIHKKFQEDLIRMRLLAARTMMQVHSEKSMIGNEKELVKLSAQVLGLGPKFTLILNIENMSAERALMGLSAVFHCKTSVYKLSRYMIVIPLVPPSLSYKTETKVDEITKGDINVCTKDHVLRIFLVKEGQSRPILAATINMPNTDPLAFNL